MVASRGNVGSFLGRYNVREYRPWKWRYYSAICCSLSLARYFTGGPSSVHKLPRVSILFRLCRDYDLFFCGKMFRKFSVLGNLTCAQETLWRSVAWCTQTFFIRSSNWKIPNTAHAQSVELSDGRRSMQSFTNIDYPDPLISCKLSPRNA